MNKRAYIAAITLIGKLAHKLNILDDILAELTPEEKELVRDSLREYQFYHAHERVEAGTELRREATSGSQIGASATSSGSLGTGAVRKPGRPPKGF